MCRIAWLESFSDVRLLRDLTNCILGCIFETTIPTVGEKGFTLEKIILWATNRTSGGSSSGSSDQERLPPGEALACQFLARCFELDPAKRISADEALQHEFLNYYEELPSDDEEGEEDPEMGI